MQFTHKLTIRLAFFRVVSLPVLLFILSSCEFDNGGQLGPTGEVPDPSLITRLVLKPARAAVEVNQRVRLTAEGRSGTGKRIAMEVEWSASGGTIAPEGIFSAAVPGSYTVYVRGGNRKHLRDSTVVWVSPSAVTEVEVSPGSAWLVPSARQVFTAIGRLKDSSVVQLPVRWTASAGTIDSAGLYQAPTVHGSYLIIATFKKGLADTAVVRVSEADPGASVDRIVLTPALVSLTTSGTQAFTAAALMSNNETAPVEVSYRVTGGTITAEGLYTAGQSPGTHRVIATEAGGEADTSAVTITSEPPTVEQLVLTPASASLQPGGTQQFSATAEISDGSTAPAEVTYSVTGGTVTAGGLYTADSTSGSYRVIATAANGKADTSAVTITAPAATLAQIVLTPAPVTLLAGARQQFSAAGKMSDGTTTTVPVIYAATGGTITADGLYSAGQTSGSYRVVAKHQGGSLADTSAVTITESAPGGTTGEQARMADSLVESIGVNNHLERGDDTRWTSIVRPRTLELGLRHVRWVADPGGVTTTALRRMRELYDMGGIKAGWGCRHKDNYTDASHCITQLNALLSGGSPPPWLEYLTGENEMDLQQNGGGPDYVQHWVQWQTAIDKVYKAQSPWRNYPVLMSSISQPGAQENLGYHAEVVDVADMHSYSGALMPSEVSSRWIPAARDVVGANKPIWATEAGYHNALQHTGSHYPISERGSGKYVSRLWFEYWNRGVDRTYIYELRNKGTSTDPASREDNFGQVRVDGTPKPQFHATKHIIALLKDPGPPFTPGKLEYTLSGALSTTHKTLMQKRNGTFYLALWQEVSVWDRSAKRDLTNPDDPVTLTLARPASAIRVYRPLQGTSAVQTGSGTSIALSVPDEVLIVEVTP